MTQIANEIAPGGSGVDRLIASVLWTPIAHKVVLICLVLISYKIVTRVRTFDSYGTELYLDRYEVESSLWSRVFTTLFCTLLYYSVLFCTFPYYSVLFFFSIIFCNILYFVVLFCTFLRYSVLFCAILYFSALFCTFLYFSVLSVVFCTFPYYSVVFCTFLYYSVIFCTFLYYSVVFCTFCTILQYSALCSLLVHGGKGRWRGICIFYQEIFFYLVKYYFVRVKIRKKKTS